MSDGDDVADIFTATYSSSEDSSSSSSCSQDKPPPSAPAAAPAAPAECTTGKRERSIDENNTEGSAQPQQGANRSSPALQRSPTRQPRKRAMTQLDSKLERLKQHRVTRDNEDEESSDEDVAITGESGGAGEEACLQAEPNEPRVVITIKQSMRDKGEAYKIKLKGNFEKMFHEFCKKRNLARSSVRFTYDGEELGDSNTLAEVDSECEDGDEVTFEANER